MATSTTPVRPGDLIRAEDFNAILDRLDDLDSRVSALESVGGTGEGTDPIITAVTPASPRVGDTLTVLGQRFDFSIGAAQATVDGVPVTLLFGSSDTMLKFKIPSLTALPDTGRAVPLVVRNLTGSTSRTITVLPQLPVLQGGVDIEFLDTTPAIIPATGLCTFHYQLISTANLPVTLTIAPTVSVPAWQPLLQVLDDAQNVVASRQITVGAGLHEDFFVRAQLSTVATAFMMMVDGEGEGLSPPSAINTFVVGEAGSQNEHIQLTLEGAMDGSSGDDVLVDSTVSLPPSTDAEVTYEARFDSVGIFTWTADFDPAATGWTDDTSAFPDPIPVEDLGSDGWAVVPLIAVLTSPSSAPSTQPVRYIVTLRNQADDPITGLKRDRTLNLVVSS